jgi:hypothetical protein
MTAPLFPPRPRLRLVPPSPPPRRLEVRFHVLDGRHPFGRTRVFRPSDRNLQELIDAAIRLEPR